MKKHPLSFLTAILTLCLIANYLSAQQYVASFSWGNYLNQPEDQIIPDGPCSAFATVSATEAAYRLFFNTSTMAEDYASVKFSNQLLYSYCSFPYSDPGNGSSIKNSLKFLQEQAGVYREYYYDYHNIWDSPYLRNPNYTCDNPDGISLANAEKVKITSYTQLTFSTSGSGDYNVANDNDLKKILIQNGPVILNIQSHPNLHPGHGHSYVLAGWTTSSTNKPEWILYDSWPASDPSYYGRIIKISDGGARNVNLVQWLCTSTSNGWAYVINLRIANGVISSKNRPVNCPADNDGDGLVYWGLGPKPNTCPSGTSSIEDNALDNNPLEGHMDAYGNYIPLPIPLGWITVREQSGKTTLCKSQTYTIVASTNPVTPVAEYSWTATGGGITIVPTSGSSATITTSSTYTSGQVGVKLRNNGGWTAFKYASFGLMPVIDYNTITVKEQYNRTTLCPNTNYVFVATGPSGVLQWDWYIRGNISEVSRSGNTLTIRTSSTFSYAVVAAKARNCSGWSSFKYSQNYYVCSGLKSTEQPDVSKESTSEAFTAYPNPVEQGQDLNIAINDLNGSIKVYDIAGAEMEVKMLELTDQSAIISTSLLKPGVYLIKASTIKGTFSCKFVVK